MNNLDINSDTNQANKTILWSEHLALGAKFTDFAGYQMPINYGSQIEEHTAVRTDAGMFDVSHMSVIEISEHKPGESKRFLSYLLANDIDKAGSNKALYSCMCNEQGGIIDDLIVYNINNSDFRMVVNAGTKHKDFSWLEKNAKDFDIKLNQRNDLAVLGIQGPNAREKAAQCLKQCLSESLGTKSLELKNFECYLDASLDQFVSRTGYTGEDGFEVIVPNDQAQILWQALLSNGIKACGLGARDTLRLEAGMNLYGHDMDETTSPLESGLTWTVAFEPADRNFVGRGALETQKQERKEASVKKQMVGLVLQDRGVLREGQIVNIKNVGEGIITSGTFSPTLQVSIAMARVNINCPLKDLSECEVVIRNKPLRAKLVKYPFVRNNKAVYSEYR